MHLEGHARGEGLHMDGCNDLPWRVRQEIKSGGDGLLVYFLGWRIMWLRSEGARKMKKYMAFNGPVVRLGGG